jgi:hypothetical protein
MAAIWTTSVNKNEVNQPQITQINTDLKNKFLALKYKSLVPQLIFAKLIKARFNTVALR